MSKSQLSGIDRQLTVEAPRARTKNRPDSETMRDRQWFGMKASPLDQDTKYTLALVANRNAVDPKRHYRKEEYKHKNKGDRLCQVGTIVQGNTEFYSARLTKAERKSNLAEEVLADERLRPYLKRKFNDLQEEARKRGWGGQGKKKKKHVPVWKRGAEDKKKKFRY